MPELNKHLEVISDKIKNKNNNDFNNVSTLTGYTSRALFLTLLTNYKPEQKESLLRFIKNDIRFLNEFIENHEVSPYNIDGLVGFGTGISYLCQSGLLDYDENEILSELDEHIFQLAKNDIITGNYDLFYGLIGCGNYFIQRVKVKQNIKSQLKEIGDGLVKCGENKEKYLIWQDYKSKEDESIDFSISHGLSSIIIFLSNLIALDITPKYYRPIVKSLCSQLLNHKKNNRIPDCLENGNPKYSPLRWCHGELGIVSALAYASKVLNNKLINEAAYEIAVEISCFKMENQKLVSANICHGTLGVAHVFQKWYNHYWQSPEIRGAALYWYKQSNDIINSDTGFKYFDDDGVFREKNGILFGIEGMGLAIISALDNKLTDWDSFILLHGTAIK